MLAARNEALGKAALEKLRAELAAAGRADADLIYRQLDITDSQSVQAFADWARQELRTVDVLVNNAGKRGAVGGRCPKCCPMHAPAPAPASCNKHHPSQISPVPLPSSLHFSPPPPPPPLLPQALPTRATFSALTSAPRRWRSTSTAPQH